jgi:putative SbcD/Mre11-related phosphoesterase
MDLSDLQPIPNEPALFIKNKQILVVADLHIGIDSQLREQGLHITLQAQKMMDHLFSICENVKPKEIILLGDIKHNIPSATFQERKDVRNFLEKIKEFGQVHIIPGNHDGFIQKLSPDEINIHPSDGFIVENIGFTHGHRWPSNDIMKCEQIIIAHTHSTIMFTDRLEYKTFESCWIKGRFLKSKLKEKYPDSEDPEILVMPAFNPLCGGVAANQDGITGPIGKIIDIQNSQIYLVDGTSLGRVKDIK